MSRIIANNIRHNDASADSLSFDSSARVGIGTSSPNRQLVVNGGTSEGVIQITNDTSGTASANGFELIHFTNGETQLLNRENGAMRFDTNGSERMRILSGGGLTFNGDTATANALDDYEEGTWEPGYSFGGTAHTSIVSAGTYIKTGGMVFVTGYLYTNNSNTYSGTATITGLPFSIPSGMRYRGAFTVGQIRRFNEDMPNIKLYAGDNGSVISMFRQATNANGATELTNTQFNFQSEYNILSFSGSYPVA